MLKLMLVIPVVLTLSGCVTVREYDAEKMEYDQINKLKKAQSDPFKAERTLDFVEVANEDDVVVEAIRSSPTVHQGVELDVWEINAKNSSNQAKCVIIDWRLQDFDLETSLPHEFLIEKKSIIKVGKMRQTIWSFDDVNIAIPPSGYVNALIVRDADYEKTTHKLTCDTLEENIQTPDEKDTIEL